MRDQSRMNLSVLPHAIRRHMNDRLKGQPGVPRGGSLWKRVANVISPFNAEEGFAMGSNVAVPGDVTAGRLFFNLLLRNTADLGTGAHGLGDVELPYVSHGSFSSDQDNYDLGTGAVHVLNPGVAGLTISGFVAPADLRRGAVRLLINGDQYGVSFLHNQASTATNRLITPYARTLQMPRGPLSNEASIAAIYYTGARWLIFPLTFRPDVVLGTEEGGLWIESQLTEEIAVPNGVTLVLSSLTLLPADAIIEQVVGRVRVQPGNTSTMSVGTTALGGDNNRFASGISTVAGTEFKGWRQWRGSVAGDASGPSQASGQAVQLTFNAATNDALGRVLVTVFYRQFVAPTS